MIDQKEMDGLRDAIVAMVEALERFGHHDRDCTVVLVPSPSSRCDCGFTQCLGYAGVMKEVQQFTLNHPGEILPQDLAHRLLAAVAG